MVRYAIALYKFREHERVNKDLTKYLAVVAFERLLRLTGEKFNYTYRGDDKAVRKSIDGLRRDNRIASGETVQLDDFWEFRNDIVHPFAGNEYGPEGIERKTEKLLQFICKRIKDFKYDLLFDNAEFEDVSVHAKIHSPQIRTDYEPISVTDFDNLKALYDKRVGLQNKITLRINECLEDNNKLVSEETTGFDLNTGSVWLPWVREKDAKLVRSSDEKKRARTYKASLGIVFSPSNIRMGLDFGGHAYVSKRRYYEKLRQNNPRLHKELERLASKNEEYMFYDTYWFYYLRNPRPLRWALDPNNSRDATIQEAIRSVEELEPSNQLMLGNALLLCKVIERYEDNFEVCKDFQTALDNLVENASDVICDLYPVLTAIESIND